MKSQIFKKGASLLLALVMCLSTFIGLGTTASAADVTDEVFLIAFPRSGDANFDGEWGHGKLTFKNGWSTGVARHTTVRAMENYFGNICYCIEVGVSQDSGDRFTKKGETFWEDYPSSYNDVLDPYKIKTYIGRIFQYGYTGTITDSWRSQNDADADKLSNAVATQLLIWETVIGERDEDFNKVGTGSYDAIADQVSTAHPLYSRIMNHYNRIASSVQAHSKVSSFFSKISGNAQSVELKWNGSEYTAVLTDSNNVLGSYNFSANASSISFSVSGNKLTITSKTAPVSAITITAEKKNANRRGVITWTDNKYGPNGGIQDTVTYAAEVSDPVKGYLNIKVSTGHIKLVKTSEDGKVNNIPFTITGNGVNKTVNTNNSGEILWNDMTAGTYTITEAAINKYEPQESRTVTVVPGQTTTVTFNNVLRRGDLRVVKSAEDGWLAGHRFKLSGTSLSGDNVEMYATTNAGGIAEFKGVLVSDPNKPYDLVEIDTDIRYVVPAAQTAVIEWNKTTNKSFNNILKKFRITVQKTDSETPDGSPQGNAKLGGAEYGLFKGSTLVDTYTTDSNGKFTTEFYVCDSDWTLKELKPSEGYLLDERTHKVSAEPGLFSVERNLVSMTVTEDIIRGRIAITKYNDDNNGETGIKNPESGAEFEVYLSSAASYAAAKESERAKLVCNENGYAIVGEEGLPYGEYTVHQVKGWDGTEFIPDFRVFINEHMKTYRFIINNATFSARIRIEKRDAQTGALISPEQGSSVAFQIIKPDGELLTETIYYPEVQTIDTWYVTEEGWLMLPYELPYSDKPYKLVEVETAYGYYLGDEVVEFYVQGDKPDTVITVVKENMPQLGKLTITKTGEVFAGVEESDGIYKPVYEVRGLPGTTYDIYAAADITLNGDLKHRKDEHIATIVTNADGIATLDDLYLGDYYGIETAAYSYVAGDRFDFSITYAGMTELKTYTNLSFYNERQRVKIDLNKVMEQDDLFQIGMNGEILSVTMGLYADEDIIAADGSVIPKDGLLDRVFLDENGYAVFSVDLPVGAAVYVKETATHDLYILSDSQFPVVFQYAGQSVAEVHLTANDGAPIENKIARGRIEGMKIDRETEETIAGAVFGLFRPDETELTTENALMTATSDEDGSFSFEDVPKGDWLIFELSEAEGFLPNEEIYPVTISENTEIIEIVIINDRIPEIGTTATVDGEKEVNATEIFTLEDVVEYKHLIPGKEYTLKGILMDKSTGKPLLINGEEIHSEVIFIPETPSGEVVVTFTFDSKFIEADTDIVVFESLYRDGKELAVHADIEDEGQTVKVRVPKIGTQANIGGKKEAIATGDITIDDTVSYSNLTPGKEYTVKGVLMDKATGQPLLINGEEVHSEVTFTPETPNGNVVISFTFDASGLTVATEIVVFETLYREGVEIAVHADIEDEGQTVTLIPPAPPITDIPQTGDNSNMALWLVLMGISAGLIVVTVRMSRKSKRAESE